MKKVAVLVALMFALVANTFAQNDAVAAPLKAEKTSKRDRKAEKKQAKADLNLSAEQKTKMREIGQSFKGKMSAIKTDASLTQDQKKIQMAEVAKTHQAELKTVLSAEQLAKFEEMKQTRRANRKGKKGGASGDN
jgi:periplasmic protein CpxP/Spy